VREQLTEIPRAPKAMYPSQIFLKRDWCEDVSRLQV
jgi:hypothetical protein